MTVFHHNDIDGHSAAAVIQYLLDTNVYPMQFVECNYSFSLLPAIANIVPGEQVFIVDYSFSPSTLHEIQAIIKRTGIHNVTWIDHHQSSLDLQREYPDLQSIPGIRQLNISGAALTWMYLNKCAFTSVPLILRHISDYDCWLKVMIGTDAIYQGILAQDWNHDSKLWPQSFANDSEINTLCTRGEAILDYLKRDNRIIRDKWAFETQLQGYRCLALNRKVTSEVFGPDLSHYPIYCVFQFDGRNWRYSIYSRQIDCSLLAAQFGGGGHKEAAGFSSPTCLFTANNF